jgi:hypothetical protein
MIARILVQNVERTGENDSHYGMKNAMHKNRTGYRAIVGYAIGAMLARHGTHHSV